jgi:hypothetical protein
MIYGSEDFLEERAAAGRAYSKPLDPHVEARILARLDAKLHKLRQEGQHR